MSRIGDVPFYSRQDDHIDARLYNAWRRAKLRHKIPMRLPLKGLRGLTMLVETHNLVCVHETQNDLPIIAWVEFEDNQRDSLHLPIKCKRYHYHFAAEKIREQVLALTLAGLEACLTTT